MSTEKDTPKSRVLEHIQHIRGRLEELGRLCDAYEHHAHHKRLHWGHAGDLNRLRTMLDEMGFEEEK